MSFRSVLRIAFAGAALAACTPAMAYVGPGAGLGMLGSVAAVAGAAVLALLSVLLLPIRLLLKWWRRVRARA